MKIEQDIINFKEGDDMTSTEVAYIIGEIGNYDMDKWYPVTEIPAITMLQDTNFFTDPNTMRLRFNLEKELVEVVYGRKVGDDFKTNEDDKVVPLGAEDLTITPQSFFTFAEIAAFMTSIYEGPYSTYYTKYFGTSTKL